MVHLHSVFNLVHVALVDHRRQILVRVVPLLHLPLVTQAVGAVHKRKTIRVVVVLVLHEALATLQEPASLDFQLGGEADSVRDVVSHVHLPLKTLSFPVDVLDCEILSFEYHTALDKLTVFPRASPGRVFLLPCPLTFLDEDKPITLFDRLRSTIVGFVVNRLLHLPHPVFHFRLNVLIVVLIQPAPVSLFTEPVGVFQQILDTLNAILVTLSHQPFSQFPPINPALHIGYVLASPPNPLVFVNLDTIKALVVEHDPFFTTTGLLTTPDHDQRLDLVEGHTLHVFYRSTSKTVPLYSPFVDYIIRTLVNDLVVLSFLDSY